MTWKECLKKIRKIGCPFKKDMLQLTEKCQWKLKKIDSYSAITKIDCSCCKSVRQYAKEVRWIVRIRTISCEKKKPHGDYYCNLHLIERNYNKDVHVASSHQNLAKERLKLTVHKSLYPFIVATYASLLTVLTSVVITKTIRFLFLDKCTLLYSDCCMEACC